MINTLEKITIGQKIALAREEKEWSQKELSSKLQIDHATISRWENDKQKPTRIKLRKLAQVLDKSLDYFLEDSTIEDNISENDLKFENANLKIITGFRDNDFTYESSINGFIFEAVPIVSLYEEVDGLTRQEIESQFFVWIEKKDKYIVRKCNEINEGRFFLIYDDYELKIVDMKTDANKKQSSNFKPVGKLLKLIRDLE